MKIKYFSQNKNDLFERFFHASTDTFTSYIEKLNLFVTRAKRNLFKRSPV